MENTWIVLTIIFTVLISLLIFEKRKRNKANNHLSINEKFVINQNNNDDKEAISMRLLLGGKTITLIEAIELFKSKSIYLNNKSIFEKKISKNFSYYIANLTEPGYFKDDKSIIGFTFFFISGYEIDDKRHYEKMKDDINEINAVIRGKIRDDSNFMNTNKN